MDIALALNAVTTVAVVGGVIFAAWQIRESGQTRKTEVTLNLLQMLHNRELTDGLMAFMSADDGLNESELQAALGERWSKAFHAIVMLDSLGLLVHDGDVDEKLADDFFKHSVAIAWGKFRIAALDMRKVQGDTAFEYLQWLAEEQARRKVHAGTPAYLRGRHTVA